MLRELQRGCDLAQEQWVVAIDSTVVRAHHHAAGARHTPPSDVPARVLATALAEDLASAVGHAQGVVSRPAKDPGGWVELHQSPAGAGQTA